MEINVRTCGQHNKYIDVCVETNSASISEEYLTQKEAEDIAVKFLEDIAFDGLHRHEIVGKLVQLDIIDEEMIREWLQERDEN